MFTGLTVFNSLFILVNVSFFFFFICICEKYGFQSLSVLKDFSKEKKKKQNTFFVGCSSWM